MRACVRLATSGLSGTFNSAVQAARQCPELNITPIDTKTLSAAEGFQIVAAAQAIRRGWSLERLKQSLNQLPQQQGLTRAQPNADLLALEALEHALARGARIYAEVLGHATNLDTNNIVEPDMTGQSAANTMRAAISRWRPASHEPGPGVRTSSEGVRRSPAVGGRPPRKKMRGFLKGMSADFKRDSDRV